MSEKTIIKINNLVLAYSKREILKIPSLEIKENQLICLIGRNGAGKSTFLRCLAGLLDAKSGDIIINNQNQKKLNANARAKLISFVNTKPIAISNISVYDLIASGRAPHTSLLNKYSTKDKEKINQAISLLKLENFTHRKIRNLSDGERQKCMIARACAQDTPILILDEPTAFLDYPSKKELINALKYLSQKMNKLIIFSSHDLDLIKDKVEKLIYVTDKSLVFDDTDILFSKIEF